MSLPAEPETGEGASACSYLGLVDDGDLHATYATDAHRCYRLANATRIATQHQERYCLTAEHPSCPVYRGEGVEATTQPSPSPAGSAATAAAASAAAASASEPASTPPTATAGTAGGGAQPPSRPRTPFATPGTRWLPRGLRQPLRDGELSMPVATISLFALAIVVVAIAFIVNQQLSDDGDTAPAALTPTPTAAATQPPAATPTAAATQPPATPTATPTPAPTPPPTPEPTPTASIHVVVPGDTCGGIAAANDVTLDAFLAANELTEEDCLTIQPGQELIVP